jgi:hypothetical protein
MSRVTDAFEEKSVFIVVALCVLTFGLYVIYRLYQLTNIVNLLTRNPISKSFVWTAISVHLMSLLGLIYYFLFPAPTEILVGAKLLHLLSSLFHVIWIIKVRNRVNTINNVKKGSKLWLNPFLSGFFHVIYIQHKINQSIESKCEVAAS